MSIQKIDQVIKRLKQVRGAFQTKKCHKLWKKSIIFLTPPQDYLDYFEFGKTLKKKKGYRHTNGRTILVTTSLLELLIAAKNILGILLKHP